MIFALEIVFFLFIWCLSMNCLKSLNVPFMNRGRNLEQSPSTCLNVKTIQSLTGLLGEIENLLDH